MHFFILDTFIWIEKNNRNSRWLCIFKVRNPCSSYQLRKFRHIKEILLSLRDSYLNIWYIAQLLSWHLIFDFVMIKIIYYNYSGNQEIHKLPMLTCWERFSFKKHTKNISLFTPAAPTIQQQQNKKGMLLIYLDFINTSYLTTIKMS